MLRRGPSICSAATTQRDAVCNRAQREKDEDGVDLEQFGAKKREAVVEKGGKRKKGREKEGGKQKERRKGREGERRRRQRKRGARQDNRVALTKHPAPPVVACNGERGATRAGRTDGCAPIGRWPATGRPLLAGSAGPAGLHWSGSTCGPPAPGRWGELL